MPTNPFFDNYTNESEQSLIEDLVLESIQIYGHNVNYIVRDRVGFDDVLGEDSISNYRRTYPIDMYIKNYDSYEGDGVFLSKFSLEIRDRLFLCVSLRNFKNLIGIDEGITRPREGDIIHVPVDNRLYIIQYVNKTAVFYQMGDVQFYDLTCEVFEYSSEVFDTGIPAIDDVYKDKSLDLANYAILTQDGFMITSQDGFQIIQSQFNVEDQVNDFGDESSEIQALAADVIDFTEKDPFSEGQY